MNFKRPLLYGLMLGILSLTGCGGGGGNAAAPQPTTATIRLSTSGTLPPGTLLAGIGVTVVLPAGVTVKTDANGAVTNGMIVVSGVAAPGTVTPPIYTPASGATPASVSFVMVSNATAGFGTGEFATVTCDLASGTAPKAADFLLTYNPVDLGGNAVTGLTPGVVVELK